MTSSPWGNEKMKVFAKCFEIFRYKKGEQCVVTGLLAARAPCKEEVRLSGVKVGARFEPTWSLGTGAGASAARHQVGRALAAPLPALQVHTPRPR